MFGKIRAFRKGHLWKRRLGFERMWRTIVTGNHGTVASIVTLLAVLSGMIPTLLPWTADLARVKIWSLLALALLVLFAVIVCVYGRDYRTVAAIAIVIALAALCAAVLTLSKTLTAYLPRVDAYLPRVKGWVVLVDISLAAFLVAGLFVSWLALQSMSPQDYARITIGGRPPSETLQVISRHIEEACETSLGARNQLTELETTPKAAHKLKARQHRALLNISALLELGSQELDIPLPRLRDYVFQYDPAMHRKYFDKAIQNSELVSELGSYRGATGQPPIAALQAENKGIFRIADAIIKAQKAMLTYTAVHSRILPLAAKRSTSDATGHYASAVTYVAQHVCEQTPSGRNWWWWHKKRLVDGFEALAFLVRKQRAHPGFDLHLSCTAARNEVPPGFDLDTQEAIERTLRDLKIKRKIQVEPGATAEEEGAIEDTLRELKEQLEPGKTAEDMWWGQQREKLNKLINVFKDVDDGFGTWRDLLCKRFRYLYLGWCRNDTKTLLVTHGYSATVREVFQKGLPTGSEVKDHLRQNNLSDRYEIPNVFVVNSGENGDLDSRWMARELRPRSDQQNGDQRRFGNITVGHEDMLASFLDKNSRVMVVLGAECFDEKGRVIHPWGLNDHGFRRKLRSAAEVCVVIVAEGYKFHKDLLSISEAWRYHLGSIRLYEPKFVDVFVTTKIMEREESDRRTRQGGTPRNRPTYSQGDPVRLQGNVRRQHGRCMNILRRPWDNAQKNKDPVRPRSRRDTVSSTFQSLRALWYSLQFAIRGRQIEVRAKKQQPLCRG